MRTERASAIVGLTTVLTTLVCWAFPILFVTLGLGSVIASVVEVAPWFARVGRYKALLFGASGVLLAVNYWLVVVRPRRCEPGELCHVDTPFMRFNRRLYWISLAAYLVAVAITYGGILVIEWLDASSR